MMGSGVKTCTGEVQREITSITNRKKPRVGNENWGSEGTRGSRGAGRGTEEKKILEANQ